MKILVIQQKMIGDVLSTSILFEALRNKYPKSQLDYLINTHTFPVVENNPFIDNFVFFTKEAENSKRKLLKLVRKIKKSKYDVVIDVYSKLSSNLITLFSGAETKMSYYKPYSTFVYSFNVKRRKSSKFGAGLAIENRLQLLEPLGINLNSSKPKIYLTEKELIEAKLFLRNNGIELNKPLFMISVLGSDNSKTYPFKYMARVIDTIAQTSDSQLLFNYIPSQVEEARSIYELCKSSTQKQIMFNVFGKSLREFLTITYHCNALIGNEGGAVNMAKALNIPTFTIFSPWIDKETWNIFEDDKNISVHLRDFKPEMFNNKSNKKLKKQLFDLYKYFSPDLFEKQLEKFLNQLTV